MKVFPKVAGKPAYVENGTTFVTRFDVDLQLGLVRTSRQLYSEASLTCKRLRRTTACETSTEFVHQHLVYHNNTFSFDTYSEMARFRLSLRDAQLGAVRTIAISPELLRELHGRTWQASFHQEVFHHGTGSHETNQERCPDPFCKAWRKLPDKLTLMFPHLRGLVITRAIPFWFLEERKELEGIAERMRFREGLEDVVISG
jgi:hypothetical protein